MTDKKFDFKQVFTTAKVEYVKWITNPRIIIFFVFIILIKTLVIEPLMERADKMELPINMLEPFIAVGNSSLLAMFMPAVFLVLMSDFPVMSSNTLFFINRTGRTNWYLGQILFSLMSVVTYVLSVVVFSAIFSLGNSYLGTDWSESTRKYAFKFPNDTNGFVASLLPSNLYNQVPLVDTVLHTVALMVMYLFVVTMLIFLFKVIHMKTAGIFAAMVYIASGAATCSGRMDLQWLFPTANSVIWVHYTAILREPIKPVWYSYAYFGVLIAGLVIANLIAVKKVNFYGGDD